LSSTTFAEDTRVAAMQIAFVRTLPPSCSAMVVNGVKYQQCAVFGISRSTRERR